MFSVLRFNVNILTKVTAHSYSIHLLQALGNVGILNIARSVISYSRSTSSEDSYLHNLSSPPSTAFACSFSSEEIARVSPLQFLAPS